MRTRLAIVVAAWLSAAFVPPSFQQRPAAREAFVDVTDAGQMYDLINSTDCIAWPSPEAKEKGGQSGWNGFRPKNGDRGVAVAWTKHCFQDVRVVFVRIDPYYVPLGESGVAFQNGARLEDLPEIKK